MATELITKLAKLGAQIRLEELKREMGELEGMFPNSAQNGQGRVLGASNVAGRTKATSGGRMSAAARKKVSQRMKKYWRERRAKQPVGE